MNELIGQQAYDVHSQVVELRNNLAKNMVELGKWLYEIREHKYWETLDYDSFSSYLAQPELGFSTRQAYYLIAIYEKLVLNLGIASETIAEIGEARSIAILPHITEENKEEVVDEAINLSKSDLIKKYGKPRDSVKVDESEVRMLSDWLRDEIVKYQDIPDVLDNADLLANKILAYVNRNGRKNT